MDPNQVPQQPPQPPGGTPASNPLSPLAPAAPPNVINPQPLAAPTAPDQPPQPTVQPSVQPPQFQPGPAPVQPMVYGSPQPPPAGGGSRKKLIVIAVVALVVLAMLTLSVLFVMKALAFKQETKLGIDYIKALQSKDYAQIENLTDPELQKIVDRFEKISGKSINREDFYKAYVGLGGNHDISEAGQGEPHKASVKVSSGGGQKHAVLIYKVGSGYVSVLEVYGADNKPFAIEIKNGANELSDDNFKKLYNSYERDLDDANKILDVAEQYQGSTGTTQNSSTILQSLVPKQ